MKREEIISILCELHKISGLRVSLHSTDFEEIAAYPEHRLPFCEAVQKHKEEYRKCVECDAIACSKVKKTGKTLIYKCHQGLTEVVCPLHNFGTLTGYLMMGQVADEETNAEVLEGTLLELSEAPQLAKSAAESVTVIDKEMMNAYVKIMTICAEYMTLTNALPSRAPRMPELAKAYLHARYSEKITISDICKALGCSKTTLLSAFKNEYGTTVNNYLCELRISEAKKLLKNTAMSINAIADATGFYDQSYFSKVFLQKLGSTPSEYRRENS